MEINNGYTGIWKNKHDGKKYHLSAQMVNKKLQYYFKCINSETKTNEPYKIDLEYFLKLKSLGHFKKLLEKPSKRKPKD